MAFNYTDQANGVGVPFNYTRGNPIPLDAWSLFMTYEQADSYAKTNPVSYPGQIITVVGDGTPNAYVIAAGLDVHEDPEDTESPMVEDKSSRRLIQLGQQSESGADIYWLQANGQRYDDETPGTDDTEPDPEPNP